MPACLAIVTVVIAGIALQNVRTAGWAGASSVQPIAVSIKAILNVIPVDHYLVFLTDYNR
jgi:hypothetical protein